QLTRPMPVARNAQVHSMANVRADLDSVVAVELRPVVDELELPFVLAQWAVAARELQGVPEVELVARVAPRSVTIQEKRRHPAAEIIHVQSGHGRISRGVHAAAARIHVDPVAEPAES